MDRKDGRLDFPAEQGRIVLRPESRLVLRRCLVSSYLSSAKDLIAGLQGLTSFNNYITL